jgi:hypothetical protein
VSRQRVEPPEGKVTSRIRLVSLLLAIGVIASGVGSVTAKATIPPPWKKCALVNAKYPHGVGKVGARDHTTGSPVNNFKRSNALYAKAMSFNKSLDRDKDGIACENS